jgi:hypothetical protein
MCASFRRIYSCLWGGNVLCPDCIHRREFADVPEDKAFPAMRMFQFMLCTTRAVNLATILKEDNA